MAGHRKRQSYIKILLARIKKVSRLLRVALFPGRGHLLHFDAIMCEV
jgi:hypothetical protein